MFWPRCGSRTRIQVLITLAVATAACGGAAEEPQIRQFFRASQLRDTETLANFALVSFDPRRDGIVQSFEITNVSPRRKNPLQLRELAKAHQEAKAADDEFSKKKRQYQDANIETIDRVLKAERSNAKVKGKDAEVQAAWTKWRDETTQYAKRVSEARRRLAAERPVAELSVENPRAPVDVTKLDGDMVTKDVTVAAQVKMPDGQIVPKTLLMTLQRVEGKIDDKKVTGRWVISNVKSAVSGAKTSN